jgi:hypothetical protein
MNTTVDLSGAMWQKSTFSNGQGGDCIEVASNLPGVVAVRDSKNRSGPALAFTPSAWAEFLAGVKSGELDLS